MSGCGHSHDDMVVVTDRMVEHVREAWCKVFALEHQADALKRRVFPLLDRHASALSRLPGLALGFKVTPESIGYMDAKFTEEERRDMQAYHRTRQKLDAAELHAWDITEEQYGTPDGVTLFHIERRDEVQPRLYRTPPVPYKGGKAKKAGQTDMPDFSALLGEELPAPIRRRLSGDN